MSDSRNSAIEKMNNFGLNGRPFIFIIDFDFVKPVIVPLEEAAANSIFFNFSGFGNELIIPTLTKQKSKIPSFRKYPISYSAYSKGFDFVMQNLQFGNTYLLNLTYPTRIEMDCSLSDIFEMSKGKYRLLFKDEFVCFSPETFITIKDDTIRSYPMKGTIDADLPNALETILSDVKETAEHNTIVDLIRNDLSIIAENVTVERFRYADSIKTNQKTLLQISSEIKGDILPRFRSRFGDIFAALLPAGSITGAPKKKTVEIIRSAENYERGYYTGVCGIFDGISLDSGVMIRFIERDEEGYVFKSGGGITFLSERQSEYQELIDKVYAPIA